MTALELILRHLDGATRIRVCDEETRARLAPHVGAVPVEVDPTISRGGGLVVIDKRVLLPPVLDRVDVLVAAANDG